ncbi:MAG: histidine kinase [Gammaproteobacteria bacterium]|nr:histidine kinase [Gammaproteobacteria bacterium]MBQ0838431.1 histidine kinase [Gammaproteobacteria bacterium]
MELRKDKLAAKGATPTALRPELPAVGIWRSGSWLGVVLIGQCLFLVGSWLGGGATQNGWPVLAQVCALALGVSAIAGLIVWFVERMVWTAFAASEVLLSYVVMAAVLVAAVLAIEFSLLVVFEPLFQGFNLLEAVVAAVLFSLMLLRYLHLQRQVTMLFELAEASHIQELQARIRPHFLFNSMNMVASLIATDPGRAEQVVVDLADLFRRVLDDAHTLVPLREELALCRSYLALEKLRLGKRLQTEWEIGDYGDVKIPSLTLQPVLENAVYHGIQLLPEGGLIKVSVKRVNGRLILTVGNPRSQRMQHNKGSKMAIDNVQKRLVAHFGPTAVVRAERMDNHYITHINFPLGE